MWTTIILVKLTELWFKCNNDWVRWTNEIIGSTMKLVKNTKLFVIVTNKMVVHIMNNEIGDFNQFVLKSVCYPGLSINAAKLSVNSTLICTFFA